MLVDRCIIISVREEIQRILQLGTAELDRFNVYAESEMRQMAGGTFTPTAPFCFLVVSRVEPSRTQLPFIAVDVALTRRTAIELGNRIGRLCNVELNILGRSEGEALDLASYIIEHLNVRLPVRNHGDRVLRDHLPSAVMAYAEEVDEPAIMGPGELAEALILEGTLFHWQIVRSSYQVLL